jgi:hypothetical protein
VIIPPPEVVFQPGRCRKKSWDLLSHLHNHGWHLFGHCYQDAEPAPVEMLHAPTPVGPPAAPAAAPAVAAPAQGNGQLSFNMTLTAPYMSSYQMNPMAMYSGAYGAQGLASGMYGAPYGGGMPIQLAGGFPQGLGGLPLGLGTSPLAALGLGAPSTAFQTPSLSPMDLLVLRALLARTSGTAADLAPVPGNGVSPQTGANGGADADAQLRAALTARIDAEIAKLRQEMKQRMDEDLNLGMAAIKNMNSRIEKLEQQLRALPKEQ